MLSLSFRALAFMLVCSGGCAAGPPAVSVATADELLWGTTDVAILHWNVAAEEVAGEPLLRWAEPGEEPDVVVRQVDLSATSAAYGFPVRGLAHICGDLIEIDAGWWHSYQVIAHELGHTLGLGHHDGGIMRPWNVWTDRIEIGPELIELALSYREDCGR